MKHFVITTTIGRTKFTHSCVTAFEALNAIVDVHESYFHLPIDCDGVMELLLNIKHGKTITHENHLYSVRYEDAEKEDK